MAIDSRELPRLHVVTDDAVLAEQRFVERSLALFAAFGPAIALHLRSRVASGRTLFDLAARFAHGPSRLFVNDRADVALLVPGAGVQLRRDSLPLASARALLGPERWIGYSAHEVAEARAAARAGADFVIAGTIFESASHAGAAPRGIGFLADLVRAAAVPVLAIGGITAENCADCRRAGAHGVA
ncbi:MAG TPA: thiamine phosphate synthase, partial [Longimicrobiales bacterium]|nr:thiamine phosphate synthase [Longimicrobiales bacterium]